jgi:hemoglobin/transferrin/lactoferrin receptor protein
MHINLTSIDSYAFSRNSEMTSTRSIKTSAIIPLALAVAMINTAYAQTTTDNATHRLKKVSVDAATIQSTTENTQVVTSSVIEENQVRTLDDLVRYIPGVAVDDMGRFGSNGFNIRGMDGDRVAITVDGISLGETLNPASNAPYEFFSAGRGGIDIDSMKTVEIIKGADSITAGSGALGGAVVFVTKDPADYLKSEGNDTHLGFKLGYTSSSEESLATATLANRTGVWESLLVYTARTGHETESWYSGSRPGIAGTGREIPDPVEYENDNILAKLVYNIADNHRLGLVVEQFNSQVELDNQTRVSAAYLTRTSDDKIERERYGINYQWKANNAFFDELDWRYDYQESYTLGHTLMTVPTGCPAGANTPAVAPCHRTENRDYTQELHKTVFHFDKAISNHRLSYGVDAEEKSVDYADVKTRYLGTTSQVGVGWPQLGTDFVPQTDVSTYSIFARDQVSLVDGRLLVNAGVRYDSIKYSPSFSSQYVDNSGTVGDVTFSAPTWQLGASWHLTDSHIVWAQTGSGFRAPTVENLYFSPTTSAATDVSTNQSVDLWNTVSNPDLESEESRNIEVGYRFETDRQLVGISVFRNEYRDFIEYNTFVRNPTTTYQTCNAAGTTCSTFVGDEYDMYDNIGEVTVEGVEFEGRWLLTDDISLRLAYSWGEGEEKDGTPLQSIVPASGVIGLAYKAPNGLWGVETDVVHSQSKKERDVTLVDTTNATQIPTDYFERYGSSFTTVDLQAYYQITPQFKINAGVYNLFDEEYIRWQRIRFVNQGSAAGGARGGVSEDGIHRYTEPGRNFRVSVAYAF